MTTRDLVLPLAHDNEAVRYVVIDDEPRYRLPIEPHDRMDALPDLVIPTTIRRRTRAACGQSTGGLSEPPPQLPTADELDAVDDLGPAAQVALSLPHMTTRGRP
jgi:hypothetical protein